MMMKVHSNTVRLPVSHYFKFQLWFYDAINKKEMKCISNESEMKWNEMFEINILQIFCYPWSITDIRMTYENERWQHDNNDNVISAHKLTITICVVLTYDCTKDQQNSILQRPESNQII